MATHKYRVDGEDIVIDNPTQQRILLELAHGDRQLQDLVEATGKSKPALSGTYLKELLQRGLVAEQPHPADSRRKIFRLNATTAAQEQGKTRFGLAEVLTVLGQGPDPQQQAREFGRIVTPVLVASSPRSFATAFGRFAEDEGLATHLQLDFEATTFRCLPGPALRGRTPPRDAGRLLAGLAEGMAEAAGLGRVHFTSAADGEAFRIRPE